jgi:putative proteasome-type protease
MCCALISIDSTLRSNLSVGMPLDVMIYRANTYDASEQRRITENDPYFTGIRKAWSEGLVNTFRQLPPFPAQG